MFTPSESGTYIGRAIANDIPRLRSPTGAENVDLAWSGLDPLDGDVALGHGLVAGTPEWREMEEAAEAAYLFSLKKMADEKGGEL